MPKGPRARVISTHVHGHRHLARPGQRNDRGSPSGTARRKQVRLLAATARSTQAGTSSRHLVELTRVAPSGIYTRAKASCRARLPSRRCSAVRNRSSDPRTVATSTRRTAAERPAYQAHRHTGQGFKEVGACRRSTTCSGGGVRSRATATTDASRSATTPPSAPCVGWPLGDPAISSWAQMPEAGGRAAAVYSLVETAKLRGLDPQAYLCDVLAHITDIPSTASTVAALSNDWQPELHTARLRNEERRSEPVRHRPANARSLRGRERFAVLPAQGID